MGPKPLPPDVASSGRAFLPLSAEQQRQPPQIERLGGAAAAAGADRGAGPFLRVSLGGWLRRGLPPSLCRCPRPEWSSSKPRITTSCSKGSGRSGAAAPTAASSSVPVSRAGGREKAWKEGALGILFRGGGLERSFCS